MLKCFCRNVVVLICVYPVTDRKNGRDKRKSDTTKVRPENVMSGAETPQKEYTIITDDLMFAVIVAGKRWLKKEVG